MYAEGFKKTGIKEKKQKGCIHRPLYGTLVSDFMLRQDAGKFMLWKYLSHKKTSWQRRRRLGMAGLAAETPIHAEGMGCFRHRTLAL